MKDETVRKVMREMGSKGGKAGGKKGGTARMASLTPEERTALGKAAARAKARKTKRK